MKPFDDEKTLDKVSRPDSHQTVSFELSVEDAASGPGHSASLEKLGPYRILNKIAEHGQGIVYRADHPNLNRQVVHQGWSEDRR